MADRAYLSSPAALDAYLRDDLRDAENGDAEATRELHRFLAEYLRAGKLTPLMRDTLAGMHESIAAGRSADIAMLTKPLAGRPPQTSRDLRIHAAIADRLAIIRYANAHRPEIEAKHERALPRTPAMAQLYRDAARRFGVPVNQVKRIYLAHSKAAKASQKLGG